MPRRAIAVLAVVLAVAVLGSGIYLRVRAAGDEENTAAEEIESVVSAAGAFATDVPIPVRGEPVVRDTLVLWVRAAGQAAAVRQTILHAQVDGAITRLAVRENDPVRQGQHLISIDPAEYELQVEAERARVEQARAQYEELILFDDRIEDPAVRAERERVARARSGLAVAEVALRQAELNLERARLAAPFGGRVASLKVVPGQWVRSGDELMTIVELDPIRVEVQVLETEIGHLAPGRSVRVAFTAFPGEDFVGRIETINPVVDRETSTARVSVLIPNPDGRILPGMYARVGLEGRRYADRILVPRDAVLERDRRTLVLVYEGDERGGLAKWRYVTTGLANEWQIELVPDGEYPPPEPGQVVLIDGHYTLIHDARVRLVDDVREAGGRPQ